MGANCGGDVRGLVFWQREKLLGVLCVTHKIRHMDWAHVMSIRGNVDVASDKHIAGARVPMHAHPALNSPPAFCGDVLVVKIHRMGTPLREVPEHEAHAIEVTLLAAPRCV